MFGIIFLLKYSSFNTHLFILSSSFSLFVYILHPELAIMGCSGRSGEVQFSKGRINNLDSLVFISVVFIGLVWIQLTGLDLFSKVFIRV